MMQWRENQKYVDDVILSQLEDLEKETLKWCIEITWNIPTTICVLKAGVHSVMGMADFKYVFSIYWLVVVTNSL